MLLVQLGVEQTHSVGVKERRCPTFICGEKAGWHWIGGPNKKKCFVVWNISHWLCLTLLTHSPVHSTAPTTVTDCGSVWKRSVMDRTHVQRLSSGAIQVWFDRTITALSDKLERTMGIAPPNIDLLFLHWIRKLDWNREEKIKKCDRTRRERRNEAMGQRQKGSEDRQMESCG